MFRGFAGHLKGLWWVERLEWFRSPSIFPLLAAPRSLIRIGPNSPIRQWNFPDRPLQATDDSFKAHTIITTTITTTPTTTTTTTATIAAALYQACG